jgi:hypothetical protein
MTLTYSGTITITGTGTLTSGGKTLGALTVNGSGITATLGDYLILGTNTLTVTQGTFTTSASNYNITAGGLSSNNSNVRTISLNGSTCTFSGSFPINFTANDSTPASSNLTFNAGTSQVNITHDELFSETVIRAGGVTFYNLTSTKNSGGDVNFSGENTFNNLTITSPSSGITRGVILSSNQTISGTLTTAGSNLITRISIRSNVPATARTLTVATLSANNCDFTDITLSGAASPASPTGAGDCGGNTNITFPSPKTVYWNLSGTQNWTATGWATTSGGTPNSANYPLAQDTVIFDNTGSAGTVTLMPSFNIAAIDASSRTSAMTLTVGNSNLIGSFILGSGVSVTSGGFTRTLRFRGNRTQTLTVGSKLLSTSALVVEKNGGSVVLGDILTLNLTGGGTNGLQLLNGTFNANNYDVTIENFLTSGSSSRTLTMGSGLWTFTSDLAVWSVSGSGFTFNKDTANILLSSTGSGTLRTFNGGGLTYNKLTIGGATGSSITTINGTNIFSEIASIKTVAHTLRFQANTTNTFTTWNISGSLGNLVTIASSVTTINHTLAKAGAGIVSADYLNISRSTATPGTLTWYAGANSTDSGNNSGWIFSSAPTSSGNLFLLF